MDIDKYYLLIHTQYRRLSSCKTYRFDRLNLCVPGKPLKNYYSESVKISLFLVGMLKEAVECMESYLLFFPDSEQMLTNRGYYLREVESGAIDEKMFQPREDAVRYQQRDQYEKDLIRFISTQFVFNDDEPLGAKDDESELVMSSSRWKKTGQFFPRNSDNSKI